MHLSRPLIPVAALVAAVGVDRLSAAPPATAPAANPNAATRPSDRVADAHGLTPPVKITADRGRQVMLGLMISAATNHGRFPDNLGSILKYLTPHAAAVFVTPGDDRRLAPLPDPVNADWVAAHTSWTYLAKGVKISRVHDVPGTSVIHTPVDAPFDTGRAGPVVVIGYADGHVEAVPVEKARAVIAASIKALAAGRP